MLFDFGRVHYWIGKELGISKGICKWAFYAFSALSHKIQFFYAPASKGRGHIVLPMSIRLSVSLSAQT